MPTFVFDEVDAGIGGKAAVEVGRRLARLAGAAQVVVVTHLPQVAAFADTHVRVSKSSDRFRHDLRPGRARTTTSACVELSRMLAGLEDSASARAHARGAPRRPRAREAPDETTYPAVHQLCRRGGLRAGADGTQRGTPAAPATTAGDIAVIDQHGPRPVHRAHWSSPGWPASSNTAASISGRYPNLGPELLAEAGIAQVDMVGPEVLTQSATATRSPSLTATSSRGDDLVAAGRAFTPPTSCS